MLLPIKNNLNRLARNSKRFQKQPKGFFTNLKITIDEKNVKYKIIKFLTNRGYHCDEEFEVVNRGDGQPGKISIVASKDGEMLAIELGLRSPTRSSVYRLQQLPDDYKKFILLRNFGLNFKAPTTNITVEYLYS